jgi:hypothetical protein
MPISVSGILRRAEHDSGFVHRLLPGSDRVQEAGPAERQRVFVSVLNGPLTLPVELNVPANRFFQPFR